MDLKVADGVSSDHVQGDHDRGDDFVADLRGFLHVAGNDVDGVPGAALDISSGVHLLLDEEAGIESLLVRVVEINGGDGEVVVKLDVRSEHVVCLLLEAQELLRREESRVGASWEVGVAEWRSVRVTITVVLVPEELLASGRVSLALYSKDMINN